MPKSDRPKKIHNISIEERKVLKATGISDVEGFDDTKVYAMLEDLAFTIGGKNLKVVNFSAESGDLTVEGEIDSVAYSPAVSRKSGILARIFR